MLNRNRLSKERSLLRQIDKSIHHSKSFIDSTLHLDHKILSFLTFGKRLRSKFIIQTNRIKKPSTIIKLGSMTELTHASSLIHDDIVDESNIRRGFPTAFHLLSIPYASSIGYLLFTVIFLKIIQMKKHFFEHYFQVVKEMCIGQILEIESLNNQNRSLEEYFKSIKFKTASLFSFCCGLEENSWNNANAEIGYRYGMAFQILDDLYDVTLEEKMTDKPIHQDFRSGIITLPFIIMNKMHLKSMNQEVLNHSKNIALEFLTNKFDCEMSSGWKKDIKLLRDKINQVFYSTSHNQKNMDNNKNFLLSDQSEE